MNSDLQNYNNFVKLKAMEYNYFNNLVKSLIKNPCYFVIISYQNYGFDVISNCSYFVIFNYCYMSQKISYFVNNYYEATIGFPTIGFPIIDLLELFVIK